MNTAGERLLDHKSITELLDEIGAEFASQGRVAEIAIYGGSALHLIFNGSTTRAATRDVDFLAIKQTDGSLVTRVADIVGRRHGLTPGWFNDSVRMFTSPKPDHLAFGDFPKGGKVGLRVMVASPQYIMAMKMLTTRSPLESHDMQDVWLLAEETKIKSLPEATKLVKAFFPGDEIPERTMERLTEMFGDMSNGRDFNAMRYW